MGIKSKALPKTPISQKQKGSKSKKKKDRKGLRAGPRSEKAELIVAIVILVTWNDRLSSPRRLDNRTHG
jgi:hypothetical protein